MDVARHIIIISGGSSSASGGTLTAPVLAWDNETTDTTPDLTADYDDTVGSGDNLRFEYGTDSGFAGATVVNHTITGGEDTANEVALALSALVTGTYYVRVRTEKSGVGVSAWSNTVTVTIAATPPVATFKTAATISNSATAVSAGMNLGASPVAADTLVVAAVGVASNFVSVSSATLTPNGGSPISGTIILQGATDINLSMIQFLVPNGTTGLDSAVLTVNWSGSPFNGGQCAIFTIPAGNLNSQTPVDSDTISSAAASARTLTISTSAGGCYIAAAVNGNTSTNSCTWTGDEGGLTESYDTTQAIMRATAATAAANSAATNTNTITATFVNSSAMRLIAASWR